MCICILYICLDGRQIVANGLPEINGLRIMVSRPLCIQLYMYIYVCVCMCACVCVISIG